MGILEQIQQDIQQLKEQNQILLDSVKTLKRVEPEIVDIDGLIKYRPFLKSKSKVYSLVNKRMIPYYKPGKTLLFKLVEVDEYLTSNKLEAV